MVFNSWGLWPRVGTCVLTEAESSCGSRVRVWTFSNMRAGRLLAGVTCSPVITRERGDPCFLRCDGEYEVLKRRNDCHRFMTAAAAWLVARHTAVGAQLRRIGFYCPQVPLGSGLEMKFSTSMMCQFSAACLWLPVKTSHGPCQNIISFIYFSMKLTF